MVLIRVPPNTAITGTRIGIVVVVLAAFVLHVMIDWTFGVPPVAWTDVPFGTVTLSTGFVLQTAVPQWLILLDDAGIVTDTGWVLVQRWFVDVAVSKIVTFRSTAAITLLFAFVVPRDAAFVIGMRVRHTGSIILVLQFTNETVGTFRILNTHMRIVIGWDHHIIVMAPLPRIPMRGVICCCCCWYYFVFKVWRIQERKRKEQCFQMSSMLNSASEANQAKGQGKTLTRDILRYLSFFHYVLPQD